MKVNWDVINLWLGKIYIYVNHEKLLESMLTQNKGRKKLEQLIILQF